MKPTGRKKVSPKKKKKIRETPGGAADDAGKCSGLSLQSRKEPVGINLSIFFNSEARISKSETNPNHLNPNVPDVEGTENMVILQSFEQRVLNLFRISICGFRPIETDKLFLNTA